MLFSHCFAGGLAYDMSRMPRCVPSVVAGTSEKVKMARARLLLSVCVVDGVRICFAQDKSAPPLESRILSLSLFSL